MEKDGEKMSDLFHKLIAVIIATVAGGVFIGGTYMLATTTLDAILALFM